jgi:molybdopterin adenylyltransferase
VTTMATAVGVTILVVSSGVAAGATQDTAGPMLAALIEEKGHRVHSQTAVSDEQVQIEEALRRLCADPDADVLITVGGSGLTPDDLAPEATAAVIDRAVPGIAEALRAESMRHTPMGMLSRGIAGVYEHTLIVNLPGSPRAVEQLFGVLAPVLAHAVATIRSPGGSRALHGDA